MPIKNKQQKILQNAKKNIALTLEQVGLAPFVSLEEIEQELLKNDTAFQSLLVSGILRRIMAEEDDKTAKLFIPSITEWKNHLPREDLEGLTPFEYREKYPPGKYEMQFVAGLMEEYQKRLESFGEEEQESFNLEEDFRSFQKNFLERLPAEQPSESKKLKNLKEIIIEERKLGGCPKEKADKIGIQLFAENTAEGLGSRFAETEDKYHEMVKELAALQAKRSRSGQKRIKEIYLFFKKVEPYFRCAPEPHRFYLNYASVLLLEDKIEKCLDALDTALRYEPDYKLAQKMKKQINEFC